MNIDVLSSFRQGQVAMMPGFTMNIFQALETFRGMEFDMTLQPKVKCFSQWASSHAICISKDTKYPEEAWKLFLKFQEREFQLPMSHRMLPARSSLVEEALAPSPDRPANYRVLARALAVMAPTPRVPHLQEADGRILPLLRSGNEPPPPAGRGNAPMRRRNAPSAGTVSENRYGE